ncbi:MAG: hypothetical protein COB16_05045 [Rhodobacteraceae bacterium]|nr:MAG: hypothetical protein COB16_05045 [Paracoccaceae bacterium]
MKKPLYKGGGFEVTANVLKTWKRTYKLKNVEMVTLHQPFLIITGFVGAGLIGFSISLSRYLYMGEKITLIGGSILAIIVASNFGSIKVQSLALREDQGQIIGLFRHLKLVKMAVDTVIDQRGNAER